MHRIYVAQREAISKVLNQTAVHKISAMWLDQGYSPHRERSYDGLIDHMTKKRRTVDHINPVWLVFTDAEYEK